MPRLVKRLSAKERAAFIDAARSYLRVPFRHTGRTSRGVDCVGLVAVALEAVGRAVDDRRDYGRDPVRDGLRGVLAAHFGNTIKQMRPGDVALMRWHSADGADLFNHVGIVTACPYGGLALLHALAENGEVVEQRIGEPWARRIVEAYRP
jgi:cell wall-associated NlpC family hydrolase